jgi:hypothetical protein
MLEYSKNHQVARIDNCLSLNIINQTIVLEKCIKNKASQVWKYDYKVNFHNPDSNKLHFYTKFSLRTNYLKIIHHHNVFRFQEKIKQI